jgi:hypothetical protein
MVYFLYKGTICRTFEKRSEDLEVLSKAFIRVQWHHSCPDVE